MNALLATIKAGSSTEGDSLTEQAWEPRFKKEMVCFNILALFCFLFGKKKRKRHKTKKEEEMWEEGKEGTESGNMDVPHRTAE